MIFQMHEVESRIFQSVRTTLVKLEKSGFLQVLLRFYPIPIVQRLMMSLYNAFGKSEKVTLNKDKIVFITDPKDEILKSYEANTSKIITPKSSLITETNIPTLKK